MNNTSVKTSKIYSICLIVVLLVFIIAFAFALPIWFRPFYYWQIDGLDLENYSGFTREQIITAYDDVLNYLNFGTPFKTGELKYSESGKSHFEDCKVLFDLDTWGFIISGVLLIAAALLYKFKVIRPAKLLKFDFYFYTGIAGVVIPVVAGIAIASDFENAFALFHKLFFPGKTNWIFSPADDEIIKILPEEFFMRCGILIIAVWFGACLALLITAIVKRRRAIKAELTEEQA